MTEEDTSEAQVPETTVLGKRTAEEMEDKPLKDRKDEKQINTKQQQREEDTEDVYLVGKVDGLPTPSLSGATKPTETGKRHREQQREEKPSPKKCKDKRNEREGPVTRDTGGRERDRERTSDSARDRYGAGGDRSHSGCERNHNRGGDRNADRKCNHYPQRRRHSRQPATSDRYNYDRETRKEDERGAGGSSYNSCPSERKGRRTSIEDLGVHDTPTGESRKLEGGRRPLKLVGKSQYAKIEFGKVLLQNKPENGNGIPINFEWVVHSTHFSSALSIMEHEAFRSGRNEDYGGSFVWFGVDAENLPRMGDVPKIIHDAEWQVSHYGTVGFRFQLSALLEVYARAVGVDVAELRWYCLGTRLYTGYTSPKRDLPVELCHTWLIT